MARAREMARAAVRRRAELPRAARPPPFEKRSRVHSKIAIEKLIGSFNIIDICRPHHFHQPVLQASIDTRYTSLCWGRMGVYQLNTGLSEHAVILSLTSS